MDFETTSLSGSQLFQQLKSTLAQYAPDYAEEARQYEQAKDSLPEVIRLEKVLHAAYESLFLTAMQHQKNLCQSIFTLLTKCKFRCYYIAKLVQTNVLDWLAVKITLWPMKSPTRFFTRHFRMPTTPQTGLHVTTVAHVIPTRKSAIG